MSKATLPSNSAEAIPQQSVLEVQEISNLLHLIHYRNKNQHRRAKWWKGFSMFRREVRRVLELSTPEGEELERKGKGSFQRRKQLREGNERRRKMAMARVEFWKQAGLVEGWYIAFTHLTASTRFTTLGLVILACLASVCRITNITQAFEMEAQEELHALLARFANEEGVNLFGQVGRKGQGKESDDEDLGERIAREETATSQVHEGVGEFQTSIAKGPGLEEEEAIAFAPSAMSRALGSATGTVEEELRLTETPADFAAKRPSGKHTVDNMKGLPKRRLQAPNAMPEKMEVPAKKKRRKGKADAIDDIFGDL